MRVLVSSSCCFETFLEGLLTSALAFFNVFFFVNVLFRFSFSDGAGAPAACLLFVSFRVRDLGLSTLASSCCLETFLEGLLTSVLAFFNVFFFVNVLVRFSFSDGAGAPAACLLFVSFRVRDLGLSTLASSCCLETFLEGLLTSVLAFFNTSLSLSSRLRT